LLVLGGKRVEWRGGGKEDAAARRISVVVEFAEDSREKGKEKRKRWKVSSV
jgi:hypothetical protein